MENCIPFSRCLICRRTPRENSSKDSEKLDSNTSLLLEFLDCFHKNDLDSQVVDLSTSCPFCPNCQQLIAEWSSIQTQMTQLLPRAVHIKATLSAFLLSAPEIQEPNHDDDVTEFINNRIQNSQEVHLVLQQAVDDIRNELRKKYSVNVMVDKIQLPFPPRKLNQEELDPLSGDCDNDDEPMDDWRGDNESDAEYLPTEDQMDNEETPKKIFETGNTTKEATSSDDSDGSDSIELDEMKKKANRKSKCQNKRKRNSRSDGQPRQKKPLISRSFTPDGPNRFKYKGMSFQLNEEDQTYTCDECGFRSSSTAQSIRIHILHHLKKFPSAKAEKLPRQYPKMVVPDGPNKFKYNGHDLRLNDEDQCYYCGACGFKGGTNVHSVLNHIREVHYTEEDKQKWMAVQTSETEWVYGGEYKIVRVGEKLQCVSCGFVASDLNLVNSHIRAMHIDMEGADKVAPLQDTDKPSVKDLTPIEGKYKSVPYTFDPAESKYTCGICQVKRSYPRRNITEHINDQHTDAALPVICEICGKELSNQRGYKWHMKKHLTEPKNCPTCNKTFYCPKTFNRHQKIHTLGEAALKHQCEYCGKKFYLQARLRQHVRIHTGETPYECVDCGEKFRVNTYLSDHRKKVHAVQKGPARNAIRINE